MAKSLPSIAFKIGGMDCAEEVAILKREVGPIVGGAEFLAFDILNAKMSVLPGSRSVSSDELISAIARTGMRAEPWRTGTDVGVRSEGWRRWSRTVLTSTSGLLAILGFAAHAFAAGGVRVALGQGNEGAHAVPVVAAALYALSILAGVWDFLPKAWHAVRRLRPDMNLLMVVAVIGAVAIGEWFEAATVAFLFAVSLALESWSVGRARRAVEALLDLAPPLVRVRQRDGDDVELPPDQVEIGSTFVVRPGERVPLDGRIKSGASHINQAPITGESVPVSKQPGDDVYAGTINGDGSLEVESTKAAGDTTLAHIIRLVGDAQSRRAPSEQWVEKFARIYTPVIMALAALVLVVPPLLQLGTWHDWLYRSLVLLVIACPCALVISTPVSIVAALAAAARQGVLIKGGVFVELPARLKAIALDKTGTLTEGKPAVKKVVPLSEHDEAELLDIVTAMEVHSDHPLAQAIVAYARGRGRNPVRAEEFQIVPGKGATARLNGKNFWLGSHRYLEERKQETPDVHRQLDDLAAAGHTVVVVGDENHVCGFIALADRVRPQARAALQELRRLGIAHVIMLTGDNQPTARAIAAEVGIDEFRAELLPTDKVTAVEELVAQYADVAMVGDGINDAPALARASIGIAMGTAGSDAALETADIALMSDDLSKLPWLVQHSRRTLNVIRVNIAFSLGVKAIFLVASVFGFASLWAAIAADMGASLLVIFNGLRLLRKE